MRENLKFIMSHFPDSEPIWPRTVSTYKTNRKQYVVNSEAEVLDYFKTANFVDCYISAYPKYTESYINRVGIAPIILLVDIDREHFKTTELFESAVANTCANFKKILGVQPTLLWTGGGCHFIIQQSVPILEKVEDFQKFNEPSRRFLWFEEQLLTNNKADYNHSRVVSFKNTMLRVPETLNSNPINNDNAVVRIMKRWDGNTPQIGLGLLTRYYIWLQSEEVKKIERRKVMVMNMNMKGQGRFRHKSGKWGANVNARTRDFDYIEKLLDTSLDDFRNYCVWRIIIPYLVNIKRLSRLESRNIAESWLYKCGNVSRLKFNSTSKIDDVLNRVGAYWPISGYQLKEEHPILYERLKEKGVMIN